MMHNGMIKATQDLTRFFCTGVHCNTIRQDMNWIINVAYIKLTVLALLSAEASLYFSGEGILNVYRNKQKPL